MSRPNDGGPAFPLDPKIGVSHFGCPDSYTGMTLRDYFAAKAMQGCLAYSHCDDRNGTWQNNSTLDGLADYSYRVADAMLKAREVNHE